MIFLAKLGYNEADFELIIRVMRSGFLSCMFENNENDCINCTACNACADLKDMTNDCFKYLNETRN